MMIGARFAALTFFALFSPLVSIEPVLPSVQYGNLYLPDCKAAKFMCALPCEQSSLNKTGNVGLALKSATVSFGGWPWNLREGAMGINITLETRKEVVSLAAYLDASFKPTIGEERNFSLVQDMCLLDNNSMDPPVPCPLDANKNTTYHYASYKEKYLEYAQFVDEIRGTIRFQDGHSNDVVCVQLTVDTRYLRDLDDK